MKTRYCQLVILIALALSGCVKPLPIPLTMASLLPTPLPVWPRELANSEWVLDHIVVNGQIQPPYSPRPAQMVEFNSALVEFNSALEYSAHDGCNEFHCEEPDSTGPGKCLSTLVYCALVDAATGKEIPNTWAEPFRSAIISHTWSELRDGYLYWHTSLPDGTVLVFRPLAKQ